MKPFWEIEEENYYTLEKINERDIANESGGWKYENLLDIEGEKGEKYGRSSLFYGFSVTKIKFYDC